MKRIWSLFTIMSAVLLLHGMQLQVPDAAAVPSLYDLSLKSVAEKTIPQTFCETLEKTGYDFIASRMAVENDILQKSPEELRDPIKKLYREKYGCLSLDEVLQNDYLSVFQDDDGYIHLVQFVPRTESYKRVRSWKGNGFDQILYKQALVKAASEENIEALKWLLFDEKVRIIGPLFERFELEELKEEIITDYSIERKDLAVSFYSGMMRCCKNVFSRVAKGRVQLKNHSDQSSSKGRWWHFNCVRKVMGGVAVKFAAAMKCLRFWNKQKI